MGVNHRPGITVIAGLNHSFNKEEAARLLQDSGFGIKLVTFDDILNQLEERRLRVYGWQEGLPGMTLSILFTPLSDSNDSALLSIGDYDFGNFMNVGISGEGHLTCRLYLNGAEFTRFRSSSILQKDEPTAVTIDVGGSLDKAVLCVDVSGQRSATNVVNDTVPDWIFHRDLIIGSDFTETKRSDFDFYACGVLEKTRTFAERINLHQYMLGSFQVNASRRRVHFGSGTVMVRDRASGALVQHELSSRPTLRFDE